MRIRLYRNNGSLPPPHHVNSTLEVDDDGQARWEYRRGYERDSAAFFSANFAVSVAALTQLRDLLDQSGAFTTQWREDPRPPVGGAVFRISVQDGARALHIPAVVLPEQREAALAIRDWLMALIPEAVQRALLERKNVPS